MPAGTKAGRWATLSLLGLPIAAPAQTLTLDEAVESALANHPSLAGAAAQAEAAEEALASTRAARLPGLSLGASMTRFQEPMVVAPLHDFDPSDPPSFDEGLVQGRLGLQYTLFDAGARSHRIDGADARAEAARYGTSVAEMGLLEQVSAAYVGVLATRSIREAAEAQLEALGEERARALQRMEAGTAAELEVLRASASLQEAVAQATSARVRVGLAERSLARVTGIPAARIVEGAVADVSPTSTQAMATQETPAPSRLPEVARSDQAVRSAEAALRQERSGRIPRVDLSAGVLDYGTTTGEHVAEWQAGLQLSWPVFTGGARAASIRRAEAELRAAQSDLASVELQLAGESDAAEARLVEADELLVALESAVAQWEEVARIEALALEAGVGVQSDLLLAQAGLFEARSRHATARYDAVLARVSLARARGVLSRDWMTRSLETSP